MTKPSELILKVTLSLLRVLVARLNAKAERLHASRSQIIAPFVTGCRATGREREAAEGYRFYAEEAVAYAAASASAVSEAIADPHPAG